MKAQSVLEQYQHLPSFHGIQEDCDKIVGELKAVLKARLDDNEVGVSRATPPCVVTLSLSLFIGKAKGHCGVG